MKISLPQSDKRSPGYIISVTSALILSGTAILARYLTENYQMPAMILAFWRDFFVVCTLLPVLLVVKPKLIRVEGKHLGYLACYGLVLAAFNFFWTVSVAVNGAAIATVLVYCSTAFTTLLGRWLLNEDLTWTKILTVAMTLGGCVLISGMLEVTVWQGTLGGILIGVGSGLGYAFYSLMGRSASQRGLNPWTTLIYTFGFATVFLFFLNLLPEGLLPGTASGLSDFLWLGGSVKGWVMLFLLAAGPTVLGFGLYNVSLGYLPSSVVNLIVTFELVFTAILAFLLLGERLQGYEIIGSLLIMVGVLILRMSEGRLERQTQTAIN
jgi:drug/metabolite transporter (DMT)-like permease